MSRIVLLSDVRELRLRKERELKFYANQLMDLTEKVKFLMHEVDLTKRIINMIEHETIVTLRPPIHRVVE